TCSAPNPISPATSSGPIRPSGGEKASYTTSCARGCPACLPAASPISWSTRTWAAIRCTSGSSGNSASRSNGWAAARASASSPSPPPVDLCEDPRLGGGEGMLAENDPGVAAAEDRDPLSRGPLPEPGAGGGAGGDREGVGREHLPRAGVETAELHRPDPFSSDHRARLSGEVDLPLAHDRHRGDEVGGGFCAGGGVKIHATELSGGGERSDGDGALAQPDAKRRARGGEAGQVEARIVAVGAGGFASGEGPRAVVDEVLLTLAPHLQFHPVDEEVPGRP